MSEVFRWSFSQWETYNQCPAKWKYQSVLKLPRSPAGPHAARGTDLHDRTEAYIKGDLPMSSVVERAGKTFGDLTQAVAHPKYMPVLDEFKDHPNGARYTELKIAYTHDWRLVPQNDPEASCIMVFDAVRVGGAWQGVDKGRDDGLVRVGEWKSGKPKDTHGDQRKMYALGALMYWPCTSVEVTTYYLEDTAPPARLTASHTAQEKLKALWSGRRDLMIRDEIAAPRSGWYCRYCDYRASAGGPCKMG